MHRWRWAQKVQRHCNGRICNGWFLLLLIIPFRFISFNLSSHFCQIMSNIIWLLYMWHYEFHHPVRQASVCESKSDSTWSVSGNWEIEISAFMGRKTGDQVDFRTRRKITSKLLPCSAPDLAFQLAKDFSTRFWLRLDVTKVGVLIRLFICLWKASCTISQDCHRKNWHSTATGTSGFCRDILKLAFVLHLPVTGRD